MEKVHATVKRRSQISPFKTSSLLASSTDDDSEDWVLEKRDFMIED